jgi:anthranilate 1,2-dioxygenase large subunit
MFGSSLPDELRRHLNWPDRNDTIPRAAHTDPTLFEYEMERIFQGPTWHLVAHGAEIPEPGDYKTWYIGKVPIIVTRDADGLPHVLVNSCAHRGAKLVTEPYGKAAGRLLECIYHAWTYGLDGACKSIALPQNFPEGFRREDQKLRSLRTATLGGAIFATFSAETPPLEDYLGDPRLVAEIRNLFKDGQLVFLGSQKVTFDCNWKVYAENIGDNYHAVCLHLGTRLLAGKRHSEEINHSPTQGGYGHVWTQIPNAGTDRTSFRDMSIVDVKTKVKDAEGLTMRNIMFLFPLNHLYEQGDALSIRFIRPIAADKIMVQFSAFAGTDESPELKQHRVRVTSNLFGPQGLITLEDATAFARVQEGAASPGINRVLRGTDRPGPPYPGHSEGGIRHFYETYRRLMEI